LVAGVNGLGKTTLLLLLFHGVVGATSVRNDDFSLPRLELVRGRTADRFKKRVADGAKNGSLALSFSIGGNAFVVERDLSSLRLANWTLNGANQALDDDIYQDAITSSMNLGGFADVLLIVNMIIFMFEDQPRLMWDQHVQRNVLRALFLGPAQARDLSDKAQAVTAANSAYRNLRYIANREIAALDRARRAQANADSTSAEYGALVQAIAGDDEKLDVLNQKQVEADERRNDARAALERARFSYDEALGEIEALKIARIQQAFPEAGGSAHYIIARLLGDASCLVCGENGGPLIDKWSKAVERGCCALCGAAEPPDDSVVSVAEVDEARLSKAQNRLHVAKDAREAAESEAAQSLDGFAQVRAEIAKIRAEQVERRTRLQIIGGQLPPSPPQLQALETNVAANERTLERLMSAQKLAEVEFSAVFDSFKEAVETKAEAIRDSFARRIGDFLVEKAEITLEYIRAPLGESGQTYPWPVFRLSMTSGAFESPSARRDASEVSMSQGEFIDLAFRLALAEVSASSGPATLIFDAPEASLDALFMRRAGAFLAQFSASHPENRLVVTSNLTNADMIPALFGAYVPEQGDPIPSPIPRSERSNRVINLLELAAPTRAVTLVGDRYRDLLDKALFPPNGATEPGL
jgi:hypothetical protein